MMLVVIITIFLLTLILAGLISYDVPRATLSPHELRRLVELEDKRALTQQRHERYHAQVTACIVLLIYVIVVAIVLLGIVTGVGAIGSVAIIVALPASIYIGRLRLLTRITSKMLDKLSERIIHLCEKYPLATKLLKGPQHMQHSEHAIHSRDELMHVITTSHVLSTADKSLLTHALDFDSQLVDEYLILREHVVTVDKNELLGPLVINDLHKTGHDRFPVVETDLDSTIGVLRLQDMVAIDAGKGTLTAEQAMDGRVQYIEQYDSLRQALSLFLRHHQHVLIVQNKTGQSIGILTLDDVIEALVGTRI